MHGLAECGELRIMDPDDRGPLPDHAAVYVSMPMDPVSAALIERFPDSLGLIANLGVGIDNIDLAAAEARGIRVSNTPVVTEDTADLTLALMLATRRRLHRCEQALRDGDWEAGQALLGERVHGKTLGIVGFGAIGQAVARRALGFGMRIIYHGPRAVKEADQFPDVRYFPELPDLLAVSDIVSLHCPLTPATRHLINRDTLAAMKPGATLINTGRGALVEEADLIEALRSGHLGSAGLDVFEFEPEIAPALLEFTNVTLLPHIGSATGECRTDMVLRGLANVKGYLQNNTVLDDIGGQT